MRKCFTSRKGFRRRSLNGSWSLFYLLNDENLVLMEFFVHGQLASLSEGLVAALVRTLERPLPCVNVCVFFQILGKCEFLKTDHTSELLRRLVSCNVSSEGETRSEFLITVIKVAFVRSFHFRIVLRLKLES